MSSDTGLGNEALRVTESDDGVVLRATIDRPAKRNALDDAVYDGLAEALDHADRSGARVVVVRGAGGNFCAGGDLGAMAESFGEGAQAFREGFGALSGLMERVVGTGAIVVAAVEGYCLAGGMGLAASCDVVLASEDATFGTPEVDVGLLPAQAMVPITRTVSEKRAFKLLFTGERFGAARAEEMGLTSEDFEAELDGLVDDLAAASPVMVEMGKEAFYAQREMGFDEALAYSREVIALVAMSEETEAGIEAFLAGETPDWRGR